MYKQSKTMYLECHSTPIVDILAVNEETNDDEVSVRDSDNVLKNRGNS